MTPTVLFGEASTTGNGAPAANRGDSALVRWVNQELAGGVQLVVATEYSRDLKVNFLMVGIRKGSDELEFQVTHPNRESERLNCAALGISGCPSLRLLRDILRDWRVREDSDFALHRFQDHFMAFGYQIRAIHPWVGNAHLSSIGRKFWFWLCHSPQTDGFDPRSVKDQPRAS
jgi:hypothetical protein